MEIKLMQLAEFQKEISRLNEWAKHGCGDGFCQIKITKGMHTNGGCRCAPKDFSEHLLWLACEMEKHGQYAKFDRNKTALDNPLSHQ